MLLAGVALGLCSRTVGAPPGDAFADPIVKTGERWLEAIAATNATAEPGEKSHYSVTVSAPGSPMIWPMPARSIWLSWKAPRTGVAQILLSRRLPLNEALERNPFLPRLVIYTNTASLSALREVTSTRLGRSPQQLTRFQVSGGADYRFVLSGAEAWDGDYWVALGMDVPGAPKNDDFEQAQSLSVDQPAVLFDLEHATRQESEPQFGAYQYLYTWFGIFGNRIDSIFDWARGGSSVWYRWVAPSDGGFSITASAPGAIPQLGVWRRDGSSPQVVSNLVSVRRIENGGGKITVHTRYPCEFCSPEYTYSSDSSYSETATAAFYAHSGDEIWLQVDRVSTDAPPEARFYPELDPWNGDLWSSRVNTFTNHALGVLSISRTAANDSFADALPITSVRADTIVNAGATFEPGEPFPADVPESWGSFWWTWVAPQTGPFLVTSPYAEVFRGEVLSQLELLNTNAIRSNWFFGTFTATAGDSLRVRSLVAPSEAHSVANPVPQIFGTPDNDDFNHATVMVAEGERALRLAPSALTLEPGENFDSAVSSPGSCWFLLPSGRNLRLLIPKNLVLSTNAIQHSQSLHVYAGSQLQSLVELQPDSSSQYGMIYSLSGGNEHYIQLQRTITTWRFPFEASVYLSPSNDQFASRRPISGELAYLGNDVETPLLSAEAGEPDHAGSPAQRSAWFEWTAPGSGSFICDFSGPTGSRLAIYRGSELRALQPVVSAVRKSEASPDRLHFQAASGEKLVLAFDSEFSSGRVEFHRGLEHDSLTTAKELTWPALGFETVPASLDDLERPLFPDATFGVVWHRWKAASSGLHSLELIPAIVTKPAVSPLPQLAIFQNDGTDLPKRIAAEPLAQFPGRRLLTFQAQAGGNYFFAVIPRSDAPFRYHLGLTGDPASGKSTQVQLLFTPSGPAWLLPAGSFIHRLDRSTNLRDWEAVEWLDVSQGYLAAPELHVVPDGQTFLRIVSP